MSVNWAYKQICIFVAFLCNLKYQSLNFQIKYSLSRFYKPIHVK